jgi:hypothetical protein
MDTVWVVTGKKISEAQVALWGGIFSNTVMVHTPSGPVTIHSGRWFKSRRAAQLALARKNGSSARKRPK